MKVLLPNGGFDFPVDPNLDARRAEVVWSHSDAPAVTTLLVPFPRMDISETLRLLPNLAGSQADESFVFQNLDPRVTIGIPKSYEIGPLAVVLPIDEFWSTRTEAANRAFQAIIGRNTSPMIPRHRSRRIRSALRANDGRVIGATYKQIAKELFGSQRVDAEHWKTSALKAQVARLCQYGRELVAADYRSLLRGKAKNSSLPTEIRRQTSSK